MINTTQTSRFITRDNVKYAHTKGVSQNCRRARFIPAFRDSATGEVCLSRFEDGSTAPVHMLDGMPDHWVIERDEDNHVVRIKGSIIAGFIRDGKYYSREEMVTPITQHGDDAPRKGALSGRMRKGAVELTLVSKVKTDSEISRKRNWGQSPEDVR